MNNIFLKSLYIGLSGFGGPAILGFIKKEFVEKDKILDESEFYQGLSLSQIIPGATAGNLLAYIGLKNNKIPSVFLIQIMFLLPAILSMLLLSIIYFQFGNLDFIKTIFSNLNVAVVAMLVITIEKIVFPLLKTKLNIFTIILACVLKTLKVELFIIISIAILIQLFFLKVVNEDKNEVMKSNTKIPFVEIALFTIFLISVILSSFVKDNQLASLYINMTKLGFMSFGGGFAAIPVINDTLVHNYHWLNKSEFLTGLTLAQMTPGPILNIATFAGYKLGGIAGAIIGSIGMFTPGFLLIMIFSSFSKVILKIKLFFKISKGILLGFNGMLVYTFVYFFMNTITNLKDDNLIHITGINFKNMILFSILLFIQYKFKIKPLALIGLTIGYSVVEQILFRFI